MFINKLFGICTAKYETALIPFRCIALGVIIRTVCDTTKATHHFKYIYIYFIWMVAIDQSAMNQSIQTHYVQTNSNINKCKTNGVLSNTRLNVIFSSLFKQFRINVLCFLLLYKFEKISKKIAEHQSTIGYSVRMFPYVFRSMYDFEKTWNNVFCVSTNILKCENWWVHIFIRAFIYMQKIWSENVYKNPSITRNSSNPIFHYNTDEQRMYCAELEFVL